MVETKVITLEEINEVFELRGQQPTAVQRSTETARNKGEEEIDVIRNCKCIEDQCNSVPPANKFRCR